VSKRKRTGRLGPSLLLDVLFVLFIITYRVLSSTHHRIMERAYALRDARENERKAIVKQKYDAQWRDACDDARTLDSKAMTIYMNQERIRQIEEKKSRKQQLSVQENDFVEEWNRQMDALAARDEAKRALRRQIDSETSAKIREQVSIWDMI
jgi:hypothetical protein